MSGSSDHHHVLRRPSLQQLREAQPNHVIGQPHEGQQAGHQHDEEAKGNARNEAALSTLFNVLLGLSLGLHEVPIVGAIQIPTGGTMELACKYNKLVTF